MAKKPTIESVDASLARWKTRLKRAITTIDKLEKRKKRLLNPTRPRGHAVLANLGETLGPAIRESAEDAGIIPAFLRRGVEAQKTVDEVVADQIKQEQDETKRQKARGRIEKMKAKQRGDLKKMPLSGKAALDLIRNGD